MLQYYERLTLREQFKLIEIAHESANFQLREYAMRVLGGYLAPPPMVRQAEQESN